jgi:hypothetical protein
MAQRPFRFPSRLRAKWAQATKRVEKTRSEARSPFRWTLRILVRRGWIHRRMRPYFHPRCSLMAKPLPEDSPCSMQSAVAPQHSLRFPGSPPEDSLTKQIPEMSYPEMHFAATPQPVSAFSGAKVCNHRAQCSTQAGHS